MLTDKSKTSLELSKTDTYYICHKPDSIQLDGGANVLIGDPFMVQAFGLDNGDYTGVGK
jgi:hypothetical protein